MTFRHEGLSLLLHQRHFRSLWLGSVILGLGNELGEAAVLWMVLRITHSPADVGLIALCVGVPGAIVYPFARVLGDRYARSRLMALGNVILAFIYGAIAVTSQFGLRWIWLSGIAIRTRRITAGIRGGDGLRGLFGIRHAPNSTLCPARDRR